MKKPHSAIKLQIRDAGLQAKLALCFLYACTLAACDRPSIENRTSNEQKTYVGEATCATCHLSEAKRWRGSHHDLAMQPATEDSVLGDFANSQFSHSNVTSRFYQQDGQFFVETDDSEGNLAAFPVRYTFGVTPLQQYLVELPNGKIQALGIAWDTRPADEGGQQWFHVYGNDPIDHTDVLHWTRFSNNWETMCADCHSTNLKSDYNVEEDRFKTTWAELDVSCEACHGPGSTHVEWARNPDPGAPPPQSGFDLALDERRGVTWLLDPISGNSRRSEPRSTSREINACAGCHSRRSRLTDSNSPAEPFLDNYAPALVDPPLYFADGQIHDEVYVYGSFLQSKMHAAGVTCSDCHDPHGLELRAPGPAVCLQCHAADKFRTIEHQLHAEDVTDCIDCHMPPTTYMQVDARSDHSLRVPRPELSVTYDVPNACNGCHVNKDAAWAVDILRNAGRLFPDRTKTHWSKRLAGITSDPAPSQTDLSELALDTSIPPIIRATAASRLSLGNSPEARQIFAGIAQSSEGLVRFGAAQALQNSDPALAAQIAPTLLNDSLRAVRIAAAQSIAGIDPVLLPAGSNPSLQRGIEEYLASQEINNERAESHVNIGNVQRAQNQLDLAEKAYQRALKLNPGFVPAYVNLADLYRQWQREKDTENTLREGLAAVPGNSALHHSLGLSLIRQQRLNESLPELRAAADAVDAVASYAVVYALATEEAGNRNAAVTYLQRAAARYTGDPMLASALAEMEVRQKSGN